ncbi:hypothetical protein X802_08045 [Thermococcus guaymasensis DSM 11113]|uniref:Uncharacterized protein n=1 Tax=Thermococcus guaymasensis DSM 11113 TaxID=1432656 RepID=A0A0X1KND9_9EURY|nr:hypothetical protein X802_08045 [Thermococcus guaymasensis DSM 11113]
MEEVFDVEVLISVTNFELMCIELEKMVEEEVRDS